MEGELVVDLKRIAVKYTGSWFFIDLIAVLPISQIAEAFDGETRGNQMKMIRLARLPRLYRLIRLLRMLKMLRVLRKSSMFRDMIA